MAKRLRHHGSSLKEKSSLKERKAVTQVEPSNDVKLRLLVRIANVEVLNAMYLGRFFNFSAQTHTVVNRARENCENRIMA